MPLNLSDLLSKTAERQPDRPAILGPGPDDSWTYARLAESVNDVSRRLENAGVGPGDCVGLHCPSGAGYIVGTYAAWRCGACVVPIPMELANPEKKTILRTISLPWLISQNPVPPFVESVALSAPAELHNDFTVVRLRPQREHPERFRKINSAFLRFTSGTTGTAKGVVLSHETIRDRIEAANEVLHIGSQDRVVWILSMSYHFTVSIVAYLTFGAAVVLPANHLANGILDAARKHRATIIYGSPVHYAWLASANSGALADLRMAVSTTTALDPEVSARFNQRYGLPLTQALGIIEIGLPFINTDFATMRPGAIGRALPAYRLQLGELGLGENRGEVLLSGKGFLDAYYEPWQPRSEIMSDGWFHTGDVAQRDADGCLMLCGRTKDVIDVLGMKFFPQEVEAVLTSHPAVQAARVFAEADSRMGAVIKAQVVLQSESKPPSHSELSALCTRELASFKVPHSFEFVAELPRTASGKVLHRDQAKSGGVS